MDSNKEKYMNSAQNLTPVDFATKAGEQTLLSAQSHGVHVSLNEEIQIRGELEAVSRFFVEIKKNRQGIIEALKKRGQGMI